MARSEYEVEHLYPLLEVLLTRTNGIIGSREVALMESANLVERECTDYAVQHTAVVE